MRSSAVLLVLTLTLAACSPVAPRSPGASAVAAPPGGTDPTRLPPSTVAASGTPDATASALALVDPADCPVSKPGTAPEDIGDRLFGSSAAVGNTDLWVGGLGDDGVILVDHRSVAPDGSIGWKFGWWRIVPGRLSITGRRLDAPGATLRASVPDGYGSDGFQASGVVFPTEGCWEVTGSVGGSELTFVTLVIRT